MNADGQLEFPSLAFPRDRRMLYVFEIATKLGCSVQHVLDLIEEGKLVAIDISGAGNLSERRTLRIPVEAWEKYIAENRTA